MTSLRQRMLEDLQIRGLSENTQRSYLQRISLFAEHFGVSPTKLGREDIREYQLHLIRSNASRSQLVQFVAAARFLYLVTLKKDWTIAGIPGSKLPKKLPSVLTEKEVQTLLYSVLNLKHRAIMMTMYSGALRVSEACNLTVPDIDSDRMTIRIRQGKGAKDRYVPLSNHLLTTLRLYWQKFKPKDYLFPGRGGQPIRQRHIYRVCVDAGLEAGIKTKTNPHSLRHSFATHLLDQGVNLHVIREILGHVCLKTTARYLHLTQRSLQMVANPLDRLMEESDRQS